LRDCGIRILATFRVKKRTPDGKKRGDIDPFHFKLRRKDGAAVWVDVQGTPMYNVSGKFNGIVGTFSVSN
jgi:PAS domain-containing protein